MKRLKIPDMKPQTALAFLVGLGLGLAVSTGIAQDSKLPGVNGVNHVSFVTANYDAMKTFYTGTLGFPEAFTNRNASGQPTLTYLQVSRNTFIELFPASATRKPGFAHFGIHVEDVQAIADRLKARGLTVPAPRLAGSGSSTITIADPDGNSIELSQLGPDAPARKAMDAWK